MGNKNRNKYKGNPKIIYSKKFDRYDNDCEKLKKLFFVGKKNFFYFVFI